MIIFYRQFLWADFNTCVPQNVPVYVVFCCLGIHIGDKDPNAAPIGLSTRTMRIVHLSRLKPHVSAFAMDKAIFALMMVPSLVYFL